MGENDERAFELIDELRRLAEGKPLPKEWLKRLQNSKLGRPLERKVQARNLKIARKMHRAYLTIERGESTEKITKVAESIAARYRNRGRQLEAKDVFDIYRLLQDKLMTHETCRRLAITDKAEARERAERLNEILEEIRLPQGETG